MQTGFVKELHTVAQPGPLSYVVPQNVVWQIMFGHCIFTSSATGGNRWFYIQALDEDGHIQWDAHSGAKQSSSVTRQYSLRMSGSNREVSFTDTDILVAMPDHPVLFSGWTLRVLDSDAIDEANDDISVHMGIMVSTGSNLNIQGVI